MNFEQLLEVLKTIKYHPLLSKAKLFVDWPGYCQDHTSDFEGPFLDFVDEVLDGDPDNFCVNCLETTRLMAFMPLSFDSLEMFALDFFSIIQAREDLNLSTTESISTFQEHKLLFNHYSLSRWLLEFDTSTEIVGYKKELNAFYVEKQSTIAKKLIKDFPEECQEVIRTYVGFYPSEHEGPLFKAHADDTLPMLVGIKSATVFPKKMAMSMSVILTFSEVISAFLLETFVKVEEVEDGFKRVSVYAIPESLAPLWPLFTSDPEECFWSDRADSQEWLGALFKLYRTTFEPSGKSFVDAAKAHNALD